MSHTPFTNWHCYCRVVHTNSSGLRCDLEHVGMQVYAQVHQLLPGAHYSAKAKILSLKTPGKRKQERLPGEHSSTKCIFAFAQAVTGVCCGLPSLSR